MAGYRGDGAGDMNINIAGAVPTCLLPLQTKLILFHLTIDSIT
ncbi:hypothetical protein [Syntrophomonas curvata]